MTDFVSKEKRSKIMKAVRAKGNKTTELAMLEVFREQKITGWRRNYELEGRPDFVFPKVRLVIFVDGCFWHGHICQKPRESQKEGFWKDKMAYNKKHDRVVNKQLKDKGWVVIRVWECELAQKKYGRKIRLIKKVLGIV
jgi:DNA mismatch endonuclease (patch repair protein)